MGKKTALKVLIADDDPAALEALVRIVEGMGFEPHPAASDQEALGLIQDQPFDLALAGLEAAGGGGLEMIRRLREAAPDLPLIAATRQPEAYSYAETVGAGSTDLIVRPFGEADLAAKIERALRERRLARRQEILTDKMARLVNISRDLISELDFDRLFNLVIEKTSEIMEAERSSLFIVDGKTDELWTKVAMGVDEIRLPMGQGVSGHVAASGETIRVADAWELEIFDRTWDIKHDFRTRAVLCMPVRNRDQETIGVIQVINKQGDREFDQEDEFLLSALSSQVAIALENSALIDELKTSFESFIRTLSATVDARHPLTAGHSERVTTYSQIIGQQMGLDEEQMEALKYSALLHDIGKLGIPDAVLLKNGRFDDEERRQMNLHSTKSHDILSNIRFPRVLKEVPVFAAAHHERVDGKGYNDGLKDGHIPLAARIMAVADVFDALTSPRDYPKYDGDKMLAHSAMPLAKAVGIIRSDSGTAFDPNVVAVFDECLDKLLESQRGGHFPEAYIEIFQEVEAES
ncbi:MAG: GAF domain-containing protein [Deltaproteobacteria bacterium]|nr:GAF domain-containing protein [Deltaproteobacteria bacterium]